jgi:hypothetical protein
MMDHVGGWNARLPSGAADGENAELVPGVDRIIPAATAAIAKPLLKRRFNLIPRSAANVAGRAARTSR